MRDCDLIVLGSGAAGLTAALTAAKQGLKCTVLEIADQIGGTSARSSGTVWVPGNHHMGQDAAADIVAARLYLQSLTGQRANRMPEVFLAEAPRMLRFLETDSGIAFRPYPDAPDYRQDMPGAAAGWRPLEPAPFDGRRLGKDFARLAAPLPELMLFGGMMVTRAEAQNLLGGQGPVAAARLGCRLIARYARDRLLYGRGTRLVMGNALIGALLHAAREAGVVLSTGVTVHELIMVSDRIEGVVIMGPEGPTNLVAKRGVVLAGGGFPAGPDWCARELPAPVARHTPASPGCTGSTLDLALASGAALGPSGRDNALWFPSSIGPRRNETEFVYPHIVLDRAKPGSLVVDGTGQRFQNEAVSYHEFVRGMYRALDEGRPAIPCWLICDHRFIRHYGLGAVRPMAIGLKRAVRSGYVRRADSLAELAHAIDVPAAALVETVARMNGFGAQGMDEDFGRGNSIYDRAGGDPGHGPNPCLGVIERPPFYAVGLHPTPLGTSRGLMADEHARVLDADGRPISGLYVAGNDMQSVFAGEYPGAGAQLAQGMTFGWLAGGHAAGIEGGRE